MNMLTSHLIFEPVHFVLELYLTIHILLMLVLRVSSYHRGGVSHVPHRPTYQVRHTVLC